MQKIKIVGGKMIKLINKIFNGKEYTLVDEYDDIIENEIIYHFISDDDDLFYIKVNNEYVNIADEQIMNQIKDKYCLFPLEIIFYKEKNFSFGAFRAFTNSTIERKLDDEERKEFFNVQIAKLKELGDIIDFEELRDRLMGVGAVYIWNEGSGKGIYHPTSKTICVPESKSFGNYINLHETIHKSTGFNPLKSSMTLAFFVEGGAESICEKLRGRKESYIDKLQTKNKRVS